jgi:DNA phosphorothioation-dependent restriction protein DptG
VKGLAKRLEAIHTALDNQKNEVEDLVSDLQAEWDERSEKWQDSDKGTEAQDKIDELANVADEIDSAMATLSEVM